MNTNNSKVLMILLLLGSLVLGGCYKEKSGPFERTGERIDEMKDNVKEGKPILHKKGALEKTGEAMDETLGTDTK